MQDGLTDGESEAGPGDLHTALRLGGCSLPNCPYSRHELSVQTDLSHLVRAVCPPGASQDRAAPAASGAQCPVCSGRS